MVCDSNNIKEYILNEKILNSLKNLFSKYTNKEYIVNNLEYEKDNSQKESLLQEKLNLEEKLVEDNNVKFNLYKDKINNIISEKDYMEFSNKISNSIFSLENRIKYINDEVKKISANHKNGKSMLKLVDDFLNVKTITRNDILQLIDKIEIDSFSEKLKIYFNFNI